MLSASSLVTTLPLSSCCAAPGNGERWKINGTSALQTASIIAYQRSEFFGY